MVPESTYLCGPAVQGAREAQGGPGAHPVRLVLAKMCPESPVHLSRLFPLGIQELRSALVPESLKPEQNLM